RHLSHSPSARLRSSRLLRSASVLVFLDGAGDPGVFHSFPTRRSSDLDLLRRQRLALGGHADFLVRAADALDQLAGGAQQHGQGRSEEHTSELQSLRHLVCRLLLEKKKTKTVPRTTSRLTWRRTRARSS